MYRNMQLWIRVHVKSHHLDGDCSLTYFYGHSLSTSDSSTAVASYYHNNVKTSFSMKSVIGIPDSLDTD